MSAFVLDDGQSFDVIGGESLVAVHELLHAAGLKRVVFPAPELEWRLLHESVTQGSRTRIARHYAIPDGRTIRLRLALPDDGDAMMFTDAGWVEVASVSRSVDAPAHHGREHRLLMLDLELRGLVETILYPPAIAGLRTRPQRAA